MIAAPSGGRVSAVVLAAGASRRMGRVNKLLAEIDGVPMIYRAVETALRSNAAEVVVVSGHQADPLRRALSGLEPRFIHNSSYRQGLAT